MQQKFTCVLDHLISFQWSCITLCLTNSTFKLLSTYIPSYAYFDHDGITRRYCLSILVYSSCTIRNCFAQKVIVIWKWVILIRAQFLVCFSSVSILGLFFALRDLYDNGIKAFVSFIRFYRKHECLLVFQFKGTLSLWSRV